MKKLGGDDKLNDDASIAQSISIIICSKGRPDSLLRTLQSLEKYASDERLLEIIIIEETNDPRPPRGRKTRYFPIPEKGLGLAFARNLGLHKARGLVVVFMDDDILPAPFWLDALVEPFRDPEVGAVGGAVLPDLSDINTVGKCVSFLGFPAGGLIRYLDAKGRNRETDRISGGNCAVRTDLARQIGGFDEFMRCVEDSDFFERMALQKKRMLFVPCALVFHKQRNSLRDVFRWFIRRGIGDFTLKCKRGGPIQALLNPLRMNFTLKLLSFLLLLLVLFFVSLPGCLIVLLITPFIWNQILWHRTYHSLRMRSLGEENCPVKRVRQEICKKEVKKILFIVKFFMDLGDEVGTFIGFFRYMRNRIFSKPFVLTFHCLSDDNSIVSPSFRKYYYPTAEIETLLSTLENRGYFILSLSAIIKRLRENHKSLFLDKILAVTFDDACAETYVHLARLAKKMKYPITIFVPTALAGQTGQDPGARVMNWAQIEDLTNLGMEIGSHTRSHCHLPSTSDSLVEEEIKGSMKDLKSRFPEYDSEGIIFSYPYGEVNQGIADVVKEAGYLGAVANFPRNIRPGTDPFQIPRFPVVPGIAADDILRQSRSLWLRELLKDLRDLVRPKFVIPPKGSFW